MSVEAMVIAAFSFLGSLLLALLIWVIKVAAKSLFDAVVSIKALTLEVAQLKSEIVKIRDLEKDVDFAHEKIRDIERAAKA